MVILYGVTHGAQEIGIFGGSRELLFLPSTRFLDSLTRFPSGTTVALEWGLEKEKKEVHDHLRTLYRDAGLPGDARYSEYPELYWKDIIDICQRNKYDITFLEDQSTWFRYNEALIEMKKHESQLAIEADMQNGKVSEERRLEDIKKGYILSLQARRIHEIERDDSFLQQIPEVQVVVVGKGHSDYWVQYQKIDGEKYSTDTAQQYGLSEARAIFTENATPNPRTAYERVSLERTIHFMETGRISDQAADYVGTWDLYNPWHGYFELFIKQKSKHRFSGIIEDCIGTATFEGWLRPNGIDFVKRYQESTEDALQEPLCYYAEGRKSEIAGSYSIGIGKMPFCMVKKSQEDPRELVLRWEKLNRMRKAEFRGV